MRFKRISVAATRIDVEENVTEVYVRLWFVPHHGFYPTRDIAVAVCAGHQCDDSRVREVVLDIPPEDFTHAFHQ